MGQPWIQDVDGIWKPGLPAIRDTTGWINGRLLFQKTGSSTWTLRWTRDTTPPGVPTGVNLTYSTTTKKITVLATAPSTTDVQLLRIKVSTSAYPSSPTDADAFYYPDAQPDGTKWSDVPVVPAQSISRQFPPTSALALVGTTYYVSIWAMDTSFNFSTAAVLSLRVPNPVLPPVTTVTKSAYFLPTDSATYSAEFNNWRSDNNYVYQAGAQDARGLWFYSNRVTSALANAKSITGMQIYIGRVNEAAGVSGAANVRLCMHSLATQPASDPISHMFGPTLIGTLNRGEYKTFTITDVTAWHAFLANTGRGWGLHFQTTSYTDDDYLIAYGAGTNSGRLWIQWTE